MRMNCCECNVNKETRKYYELKCCPVCFGEEKITFHQYIRWNLGSVLWLSDESDENASVKEMIDRCESIIHKCYLNLNKKINKKIKTYEMTEGSPADVMYFYMSQFEN